MNINGFPHTTQLPVESFAATAPEASTEELRQFYEQCRGVYDQFSASLSEPTLQQSAYDAPPPGPLLIKSGDARENDSAQIWPLNNQDDPAMRVRLRLHGAQAGVNHNRTDHILFVNADGRATYQVVQSRLVARGLSLVAVKQAELYKNCPSADDLSKFGEVFGLITAANDRRQKKQRLPRRLVGRLLSRQA